MRPLPLFMLPLTACAPVRPSDSVLPPLSPPAALDAAGEPPSAAPPTAEPEAGPRVQGAAGDVFSDAEVVSPTPARPQEAAEPEEAAPAVPVPPLGARPVAGEASPGPLAPQWSPEAVAPPSWGVRLVAVVPGTQPPRAVLAFGDGEEVVVSPGSMLEEAGLVVLAVGQRAVHVARLEPDGDRVRIDTEVLYPLYADGLGQNVP